MRLKDSPSNKEAIMADNPLKKLWDALCDRAWAEGRVIKGAPVSFGLAVLMSSLAAFGVAWKMIDVLYSERLAVQQATISNLEHNRTDSSAGPAEKRLAMKDLIGEEMNEADNLNTNWSSRDDDDQFARQTNQWINKVGHLIEDAYGKGEALAWNSDAGVINYSDGKRRTDLHNAIANRTARLKQLIPRVDTLPMRTGFDPKNYRWVETCESC
jgi:hypothetical protein